MSGATVDEVADPPKETTKQIQQALLALAVILKDGPIAAQDGWRLMRERNISRSTTTRAKLIADVKSSLIVEPSGKRYWVWYLLSQWDKVQELIAELREGA